jgi:cytidine deaminase
MMLFSLAPVERSQLVQAARDAAKRAYAPYSKFRVGAAVLTREGNIFSGGNIENASYGLTMCAERVAIYAAMAQEGAENIEIKALAVFNDKASPCSPCGACRQVIFEFGPEALVLFQGPEGIRELRGKDLLPQGFRLP